MPPTGMTSWPRRPAPLHEPARGPFEPLLSSSGSPPGAAAPPPAGPPPSPAESPPSPADAIRDQDLDDSEHARARKLEQIKDLYLTAEAIGERNVDKHFDHLLAQQRELISEYFKQSPAAKPAEPAAPSPWHPGLPHLGCPWSVRVTASLPNPNPNPTPGRSIRMILAQGAARAARHPKTPPALRNRQAAG